MYSKVCIPKPEMIVKRKFPKPSFELGDQFIYLIGADEDLSACERFDMKANSWEKLPDIPYNCIVNSCCIINNSIYAFLFNSYIAVLKENKPW